MKANVCWGRFFALLIALNIFGMIVYKVVTFILIKTGRLN